MRLAARVAPKGHARLHGHVLVDRALAPGTYHGSIRLQEREEALELHVFERPSVAARPNAIFLTGAPEDEVESELHLSNRGNVTFAIGPVASIFFEEISWVGRALVFAMREADASEGAVRYLDRVFHELRSTMVSTTNVEVHSESKTLEPGAEAFIRVRFTLPKGLTKGRVYTATLSLGGADVYLELTCNGTRNSTKRRPR